jgi:arginyl-tRNA synthetase
MKKKLQQILATTLQKSIEKGQLKETPVPDYVIEVPKNAGHGHFATNLPMTLRASQVKNPREIAFVLKAQLQDARDVFESVDIAGPGFMNFVLKSEQWYQELRDIVTLGDGYGRSHLGKGNRIIVEFVSANPTGPLHIGHGRGAALGNTLCRIFSFCGYEVASEFYINDAGRQIRLLGESIFSRWKQMEDPAYSFPDSGYKGDYILELARSISDRTDLSKLEEEEAISTCARLGKEIMLKELKEDLALFRVPFDVWYSEQSLFASGRIEKTLDELRKNGHLYTKDGALWIKTLPYGDDKDRVLRKSDGEFTYFASDISYHLDKKERGHQPLGGGSSWIYSKDEGRS